MRATIILMPPVKIHPNMWYDLNKQAPVEDTVVAVTNNIAHGGSVDLFWTDQRLYDLMGREIDIERSGIRYWRLAD